MPAVVQIFENPLAGSYAPKIAENLVAAFAALNAKVLRFACGSGRPVIADDATHLCVVGGDGTLRHVVAELLRSRRDLPVSVYPCGTVNLLARETGSEHEASRFADALLSGSNARLHYPAEANSNVFLCCASVGPDSLAILNLSLPLKHRLGRAAYVLAFAGVLWRWPRRTIELVADGKAYSCEAFYVAKSKYYAGPWQIAAKACGSDPFLRVVSFPTMRRLDFVRLVAALVRGRTIADVRDAVSIRCASLHASSDSPMPLQADGDIVGRLPLDLAIASQTVTVH